MTTATSTAAREVSKNCAEGRHHRCLGTVAVYPPKKGRAMIECQCDAPDCDHGPAK